MPWILIAAAAVGLFAYAASQSGEQPPAPSELREQNPALFSAVLLMLHQPDDFSAADFDAKAAELRAAGFSVEADLLLDVWTETTEAMGGCDANPDLLVCSRVASPGPHEWREERPTLSDAPTVEHARLSAENEELFRLFQWIVRRPYDFTVSQYTYAVTALRAAGFAALADYLYDLQSYAVAAIPNGGGCEANADMRICQLGDPNAGASSFQVGAWPVEDPHWRRTGPSSWVRT